MKRSPRLPIVFLLLSALAGLVAPAQASADQRFIVRSAPAIDGAAAVRAACDLLGCAVRYGLDGTLGRLFLVTTANTFGDPEFFVAQLRSFAGIEDAEVDLIVRTLGDMADTAPSSLFDTEPVDFLGVMVRGGYLRQRATEILRVATARQEYGVTGRGVLVAVIDTGVDPGHPILKRVLVTGYDFTRGVDGGSELTDVDQSTMAVLDGAKPGKVNQSTMAVLDQSTMAVLDGPEYEAFGHGTMVAGTIHLVAPRARILPLKAFRADGTGYSSDVLRAVHYAVREGAKVLNMSFSFPTSSRELERAIEFATGRGVIAVASVGNDGMPAAVYPAALPNVIGVASTTDADTLSHFSNFGANVAWIAAPGEAIVTTYPFGSYAAAWGTSFSAPFAAATAALLAEISAGVTGAQAAAAEGEAVWIAADVARGRLDIPSAIRALRTSLGLP